MSIIDFLTNHVWKPFFPFRENFAHQFSIKLITSPLVKDFEQVLLIITNDHNDDCVIKINKTIYHKTYYFSAH